MTVNNCPHVIWVDCLTRRTSHFYGYEKFIKKKFKPESRCLLKRRTSYLSSKGRRKYDNSFIFNPKPFWKSCCESGLHALKDLRTIPGFWQVSGGCSMPPAPLESLQLLYLFTLNYLLFLNIQYVVLWFRWFIWLIQICFGICRQTSFCCWISHLHCCFMRWHAVLLFCADFIGCFGLPLGSFVTFAVTHCYVGVIFYCSITAECPLVEGLYWPFLHSLWDHGLGTLLTDDFNPSVEDPLYYFPCPPLSAGPWGGGVHMTRHITLCFVSSFPSGFHRKHTLPLKVPLMSI